jgi:hypothetical protein
LEGIIINEVISTSNEFTILVSEEQVDVAFKVIKDLKIRNPHYPFRKRKLFESWGC